MHTSSCVSISAGMHSGGHLFAWNFVVVIFVYTALVMQIGTSLHSCLEIVLHQTHNGEVSSCATQANHGAFGSRRAES
jgi:hypothetical protein